jgi:hypothetical protein
MSHIADADRSVFAEAHNTVLDNFTEGEQGQLHDLASRLEAIIEAAKKRSGGALRDGASGRGFQVLN